LDRVVFGNDPRQGYFEGTRFVHPGLAFEITFPAGWKTQNTREAVLGSAPDQTGAIQLTQADAKGLSPEAFVAGLVREQRVAGANGSNERIGGFSAWMGVFTVARSDGTSGTLYAAFIKRSDSQFFQILGQGADEGRAFFAAARSFRGIPDPSVLSVAPSRVKVVTVAKTGSFEEVVSGLGPQAIGVEPTSVLNNVDPGESVAQGTLLKIVEKGGR
jgi:predicted Zn-dependent protease